MKFTSLALAFAAIGTQAVRVETLLDTQAQVEASDLLTAGVFCCTCAIMAKDMIEVGEKIHEYAHKYKEHCHGKLPRDEHGNEIHEIAQVLADDGETVLTQVTLKAAPGHVSSGF